MPIQKIAHLADIHIPKSTRRHAEYKVVFNNLILSLKAQQPDRIVIVGDLFNDYIKIEGELLILASKFMNALAKIAPVIITRGNHDILRSAPNRVDSIQALVESISNPKITYLNETGFVVDDNVVWAVWKHGVKKNNPWSDKAYIRDKDKTYIDLFHDPVNGCVNAEGFNFDSKTYRSINDFKGDYSFFGDIHKFQVFNETKAYCGSLIAQNYSEGNDEFHGYILWNLETGKGHEIPVSNPYNFHTISVNRFTDFDNLNFNIPNLSEKPSIRVKWQTLPATKTLDNERKLLKYINEKFNPVGFKPVNDFVEENKIDIQENSVIENITKRDVLHKIITEFLQKIGVEEDIINEVLNVDMEIESRLELEELTNIQWSIIKFRGKNFRNIGQVEIDWRDKNGVFQITGKNTAGKSSIIQLLSYILYGKTIETDKTKKYGDARFVNNRNNATSCEGYIVIGVGGEYYGIKRTTVIQKTKEGLIKGSPTVVAYYKLSDPDEEPKDDVNNIEKLDEITKHKTQQRISEIIGTYDNFIRIILTTADTLNKVLDTDSSVFIDSILTDSGLDIFDLRLTEFKKYRKELVIERIPCKPEIEEAAITYLNNKNYENDKLIADHLLSLHVLENTIAVNETLRDQTLEMIHPINADIASINIDDVKQQIELQQSLLLKLKMKEGSLLGEIKSLRESFEENRLEELVKLKDDHKNQEFKLGNQINQIKLNIGMLDAQVIKINGDVELLKRDGANKRAKIAELRSSTNCSQCGQEIKKEEHQQHIQKRIKETETEMFAIAAAIKEKTPLKENLLLQIESLKSDIVSIKKTIEDNDLAFEKYILEIGTLNNHKLEVQRREMLKADLATYPLKYENALLKIGNLQAQITQYEELKNKIEENIVTRRKAGEYGNIITESKYNKDQISKDIVALQKDIDYNNKQIALKHDMLEKYKQQEKMDRVYALYEKCIHRDGVPTQILSNILLPKINNSLSNLLQSVEFNVWLDSSDLKLKMSYSNHPNAVIDCIGGSGKERTFSSISLKVALNEVNTKSKPTIFMLDEVMGKLKDESIDEFLEFLRIIKQKVSKMIIIEQNHEINPDYVISAVANDNRVSTITLEN